MSRLFSTYLNLPDGKILVMRTVGHLPNGIVAAQEIVTYLKTYARHGHPVYLSLPKSLDYITSHIPRSTNRSEVLYGSGTLNVPFVYVGREPCPNRFLTERESRDGRWIKVNQELGHTIGALKRTKNKQVISIPEPLWDEMLPKLKEFLPFPPEPGALRRHHYPDDSIWVGSGPPLVNQVYPVVEFMDQDEVRGMWLPVRENTVDSIIESFLRGVEVMRKSEVYDEDWMPSHIAMHPYLIAAYGPQFNKVLKTVGINKVKLTEYPHPYAIWIGEHLPTDALQGVLLTDENHPADEKLFISGVADQLFAKATGTLTPFVGGNKSSKRARQEFHHAVSLATNDVLRAAETHPKNTMEGQA